jgi:thiol-disulfide isomerase/thioredoxin
VEQHVQAAHARLARIVAVLAATALALAACTGNAPAAPDPGEASPIAALESEPPADDSPGFTAVTLDGGEIHTSSFAGTPVVLWFWAPWCTICQAEGPGLAEIAAEFDGQVQFVGVAGQGTIEEMEKFVADTGTGDLVHMVDEDGSIFRRFGVVATPSHGFVTSDGVVDIRRGWIRPAELRTMAEELAG